MAKHTTQTEIITFRDQLIVALILAIAIALRTAMLNGW